MKLTALALISLFSICICGCSKVSTAPTEPIAKVDSPSMVACTMELLICPDGSGVARGGPKCEFAPCPAPITK